MSDETMGQLKFYHDTKINVAAMRAWPPERIALLFDGIAAVIRAATDANWKPEAR